MQVQCSTCGGVVAAADVNLDRMLAKCVRCNSVFDISGQLPGAAMGAVAVQRPRRSVPLPKGLRVLVDEQPLPSSAEPYRGEPPLYPRVVLERSWFSVALIFMLFFCVAWDSFLVFWYAMALRPGAPWIMAVFPLAHLAVGVGLTYTTLCGFLNRTRIAIEGGRLTITHGPLPWTGNRTIPSDAVDQLFCEQKTGNKGTTSFQLTARLKSGETIVLLKSLPEADQALYIEQLFERRLGIVDVPVAGEFTG